MNVCFRPKAVVLTSALSGGDPVWYLPFWTALEKALGAKNVKDKAKVGAMMTKIEKEKSAVKDMTFGDLIKAGKLPASTK